MQEFEIIFYAKADRTEPAKDFLEDLDAKMWAKMARTIVMLRTNGTMLREPHSKPLSEGIFELRARVGTDISRMLYFFFSSHRIVLTNGFIKKTQRTPPAEIERAKRYRSEYLSREENKQ